MTCFVLIRHGQTVWNREQRFRGQTDVILDAFGLKQAELTAQYVAKRWPVVAVYASPLQRTMQTAEVIAAAQGLAAQPLAGLLDISFGEWQGELAEDIARRYPDLYRDWLNAPHTVRFPGGEGLSDVRERVVAAVDELATRYTGETVALVSHTVVNRVLLWAVIGLGNEHFWRLRQGTCAVNLFEVTDDGTFILGLLNDTSHLQELFNQEAAYE